MEYYTICVNFLIKMGFREESSPGAHQYLLMAAATQSPWGVAMEKCNYFTRFLSQIKISWDTIKTFLFCYQILANF